MTTVAKAHDLTDRIEAEIEERLPSSLTTIHVEPCEVADYACDERCPLGQVPHCYEVARDSHATAHPHVHC